MSSDSRKKIVRFPMKRVDVKYLLCCFPSDGWKSDRNIPFKPSRARNISSKKRTSSGLGSKAPAKRYKPRAAHLH